MKIIAHYEFYGRHSRQINVRKAIKEFEISDISELANVICNTHDVPLENLFINDMYLLTEINGIEVKLEIHNKI